MRDPRAVLETIPCFAGAEVLEQLSDGPTNKSYEVALGGEHFVLRIDTDEAARLGLDRRAEKEVLEVVAGAGYGLPPFFFDPEGGICLRRFITGRSWRRADLEYEENLQRLAALLRGLHSIPPAGNSFEPLEAAARYAGQIGTREALELHRRAADAFALVEPGATALCHNDLLCQNVLEGESLTLIDWEYAGIGDPFFDLAVVVRHHRLDEKLARCLLDAYLRRPADPETWQRLERQCRFYQALLDLWNLRVNTP